MRALPVLMVGALLCVRAPLGAPSAPSAPAAGGWEEEASTLAWNAVLGRGGGRDGAGTAGRLVRGRVRAGRGGRRAGYAGKRVAVER